ncbi:unnamed protein product [Closterium sp. Yama58-4]|nr:unnamed protein product [Closterium sp. Yama58-4]
MRSKIPASTSSPRPHVHVNDYERINSPGDVIRVAMAKNASKAGRSTAASCASCDGDDGDDAEEDWPENGHDDSASGDEVARADIEKDEWWNRPVGSDDEVEEWRAGDSDNDEGAEAEGDQAATAADAPEAGNEAEVDAEAVAPAEVAALADADAVVEADTAAAEGCADAVLLDNECEVDDPWSIVAYDDVPLLKRRLRHRLQSSQKRARVVLSDDNNPGVERRPILTAAAKGKSKVAEAPAKATARRRTSNNGDPGSSKGAAKKKAKKTPNPDDIVVNETLSSDDDYAEAAGPIPSFPEKPTPKDPTLDNPNTRPPSPRSKDTAKKRHGWTVREKLKWARRYQELGSLNKTSLESTASIACIRRWTISVKDTQKWSREWMKKHYPGKNWNASSHWSQRFHDRWNLVMRVKTKVGQRLLAGNLRRPPHPVVLQWIAEAWDQVPKQIIIDAFRHCGISSKLDGTENHLVMSHLRARSTTDVSEDMTLGGTTGDNTRLLGQAPEEEEEEEGMQAEGVREVAVATGLEVLYQETPNYRGAAAEADRMIEPRETARHAWRVPDLRVEPVVSAGDEAVTEEG